MNDTKKISGWWALVYVLLMWLPIPFCPWYVWIPLVIGLGLAGAVAYRRAICAQPQDKNG